MQGPKSHLFRPSWLCWNSAKPCTWHISSVRWKQGSN